MCQNRKRTRSFWGRVYFCEQNDCCEMIRVIVRVNKKMKDTHDAFIPLNCTAPGNCLNEKCVNVVSTCSGAL